MKFFRTNKMSCIFVLLLALLCLFGGLAWKHFSLPSSKASNIPLVRTQVIHINCQTQQYQYSGVVQSPVESKLAFQASGRIIKRNVEVGSHVRAGEVLMQIDPSDAQQTIESIVAQLESAQSQYKLAKDNLNRYQQLYQQGAVSKAEMDSIQNSYNSAEALLHQLNAQYTLCQNQLKYTSLCADRDGVITSVDAEVGQVIMSTATAQPVITLAENRDLEVEIAVPENRIEAVSKAKQIKADFWALPNITLNGKIREVAPAADPVAKTFKVRITLVNPPPEIKLGMTSTVTIDGIDSEQTGILLPISAIYQTGKTPQVWVVNNGTVKLRNITINNFDNDQVEIMSGLREGEMVVTAGVHKLIEGQKVRAEAEPSQE